MRKIRLRSIFLLSIFLTIAPVPSSAVTLPVVEDTFTNSERPNRSYHDAGELRIYLSSREQRSVYVRFDTSVLHAGVTPADVLRASLRIFVGRASRSGLLHFHRIVEPWEEHTLTHANAPAHDSTVLKAMTVDVADEDHFRLLDITGLVKEWIAAPDDNHGLVLRSAGARLRDWA